MSFTGLLPNSSIAVDSFRSKDAATVFFITHFHSDHFQGLASDFKRAKIYCSPLTKKFVHQRFPGIAPEIVVGVECEVPTCISLDKEQVMVTFTFYPANHCPGSVMIYLEGPFGRYFHTGDFRFSKSMLSAEFMHQQIDRLFLDTTFFSPFWQFPRKSDAVAQIISLIRKYASANTVQVYLECDMLGQEEVFEAVAEVFKSRIHIMDRKKADMFFLVDRVKKHITTDASASRFHVCKFQSFTLGGLVPPKSAEEKAIEGDQALYIRPSTQWFGLQGNGACDPSRYLTQPCSALGVWHVLYSIHSSFAEIVEFVSAMKPKNITPLTECEKGIVTKAFGDILSSSVSPSSSLARSLSGGSRTHSGGSTTKVEYTSSSLRRSTEIQTQNFTALSYASISSASCSLVASVDENVSPNTGNTRVKRNRPAKATVLNDQPQDLDDYFKLSDNEGETYKKSKSKVIISQVIEDDDEKKGEEKVTAVVETAVAEDEPSSSSSVSSVLFLHLSDEN